MKLISFIPNAPFCYHFMHSFHLVQCADVILKDEYHYHFRCYFVEDLGISVNCPWIFCNLFQQLCGAMESMYCLLLAPWRVVQPVIDGFTTTPIAWNAVTVYNYTTWNVLP